MYYYLSFLEYSSSLTAPINYKIKISRIKNGVPIIEAKDKEDAFFALGRLHAQDRLPLMEYLRAFASGKAMLLLKDPDEGKILSGLIELLQISEKTENIVLNLSNEERELLQYYVNGINNYKEDNAYSSSMLPSGMDYEWSIQDSIRLFLFHNWVDDFLNNKELVFPINNDDLKKEFFDIVSRKYITTYSDDVKVYVDFLKKLKRILQEKVGFFTRGYSFYIPSEKSLNGSTIFGTHMDNSLSLYPRWYPVKLVIADYKISGITSAGMPFFFSANNDFIYYSFFKLRMDNQVLYKEKVRDVDGEKQYFLNGGWRKFDYINKKSFNNRNYRKTSRGYVLSDLIPGIKPKESELTISDSQIDINFFKLLFNIPFEQNISKFQKDVAGLKNLSPYQFLIGDKRNCFKMFCGETPSDSFVPGRFFNQATSYYPQNILVRNYNFSDNKTYLSSDVLWQKVNSINKFVFDENTVRMNNLKEILSLPSQTILTLRNLVNDDYDPFVENYAPLLQQLLEKNPVTSAKLCRIYLKDKNYKMDKNIVNPTILQYLYYYYLREILIDDFGDNFNQLLEYDFLYTENFKEFIIKGNSKLFDDKRTLAKIEDRDYIFDRAFIMAIRKLHRKLGARMGKWKWGRVHKGAFSMPLDDSPSGNMVPLDGSNNSIYRASIIFDPIIGNFKVDEVSALTHLVNGKDIWSVNYGTSMLRISGFYNPIHGEEVFYNIDDLSEDYYYEINPVLTNESTEIPVKADNPVEN